MPDNLYVHFPFCRARCSYCTLFSRTGSTVQSRKEYVKRIADALSCAEHGFKTVYFGGGSPALCDLRPVFDALHGAGEFTVELHPLDVDEGTLLSLKAGGVNRISMGVQSLDDDILAHMGRGYTFEEAERAFALVRKHFDNAGIDLIAGYPGERAAITQRHERLARWGLAHCSVYALQNERRLKGAVDDETVMDRISSTADFLAGIGLKRYEISNYAAEGRECRHNLAVWRGEDYIGLGEGAYGRIGLYRTKNAMTLSPPPDSETVTPESDLKERTIFRLRTAEGLDASRHPEWRETLERFSAQGLLIRSDAGAYRLTPRGSEVCDTILEAIV